MIAASVSTLVVSWKEAADSQESVASEDLVIPMSWGRPSAGCLPSATKRRFASRNSPVIDELVRQEVGVVGAGNTNLTQHLADDQLDVLVVYVHSLGPIDLLYLFHQVALAGLYTLYLTDLLGIERSLRERGTGRYVLPFLDRQLCPPGNHVGLLALR